MAYNRWLSSQYSYNYNADLMHYGRKGMKWGKHIFGLPEIELNGGSGGAPIDEETLKKMLAEGKITLDHFKQMAEHIIEQDVAANKEGAQQVKDRLNKLMKSVSDTYENFKAGDGANKKPDKRKFSSWDPDDVKNKFDRTDDYDDRKTHNYWVRSNRGTTTLLTDRELDKDYRNNRANMKKKAAEEKRYAADTARVNSKIQDRKGQESRDRKENLERKRAERSAAPRTVSKSSNQNASSKNEQPSNSELAKLVSQALTSTGSKSSSSSTSKTTETNNSKLSKEVQEYDPLAKQKKIYATIGKYLNMLISISPGRSLYSGVKKKYGR